MNISRRQLLSLTASATVLGVAASLTLPGSVESYLASVIRAKCRPLFIPDKVLTQFIKDFNEYTHAEDEQDRYVKARFLPMLYQGFPEKNIAGLDRTFYKREKEILTHFLLSTNIVIDPRVKSQEIAFEYVRFWHNGLPCSNAFANLS